MTGLARLSLANRSLVILIALVIAGAGVYAIPQLKQQLFPSLELPMVTVAAPYTGASPEIVEDQVAEPIESSLQGLDGIEEVTSTSSEGNALIIAAFDYESDIDDAVSDVNEAVNGIQNDLPDDVDAQAQAGSTDDLPVLTLAVTNGDDESALLDKLESNIVGEIESIPDVREAEITGARSDEITITPDTEELASNGLSAQSINEALEANGVSVPAGVLTQDGQNTSVQVGSELASVEDIENIHLTAQPDAGGAQPGGGPGGDTPEGGAPGAEQPGGGGQAAPPEPIALSDVADIEQQPEERTSITRTNGDESLGITITMVTDGDAVNISHEVTDKIDDFEATLGGDDAQIAVISDQAPAIENAVEDLTTEGALGLLFAVLIIMVFLLSLRSTIVTAASIPMSLVIALLALWIGDYSLNMLTLGALTISVGRVVDDSIVVLENIKRHLSYGEAKRDAVITGVREVAGAVTASTLTTVAVFLPIAFVSGMVGKLFASFAVTASVALLASLLVSLTIIPVLAYWFLKAPKGDATEQEAIRGRAEERELRSPLQRMYIPVLRFAARFKFLTVVIGIAVLAGTVALIPGMKTNFLDSQGQDTTMMSQTMPVGTDLETTNEAATEVEKVLAGYRESGAITDYQASVGGGNAMFAGFGMSGGEENRASYDITVADASQTPQVESDLRDSMSELTDVGEITVGMQGAQEATGGDAVEVVVNAADMEDLETAADEVESALGDVTGVRDVTSNLSDAMPRVQVDVDQEKAAEAGLTEAAIGQFVSQQVQGAPLGEVTIDGRANNVTMSGEKTPSDIDDLEKLEILTPAGEEELGDLAEVREVDGPVEISHTDGERTATISATADIADLGAVTTDLDAALADMDLPEGASYNIAGSSADQDEAFADLGLAMLIAIALVFIIMVATFRSFAQPLILLVSIPFAATGAIGMLRLTDIPLGVPGMIGMLMLIGIVVTNAIVLIDLINQYRTKGMELREAVIAGGRRRLRPILMTAIATICALIPMALGFTGSGGFIAQSLAIVVIGGLVSSTLLTLLLVPALYMMIERVKERFSRRGSRQKAADDAPAQASEATASS